MDAILYLTIEKNSEPTSTFSITLSSSQEEWLYRKRQEDSLTQSYPSIDEGFNIATFYVKGQLNFPNQVPENVLQLYRELYEMEQKVKALENEIAVYMMAFQGKARPTANKTTVPPRKKPANVPRKCCIPGLWNCSKPTPAMNEKLQRARIISRTGPGRHFKKNSVSTAVQTSAIESKRLSKVSWNSKVDVRYISSDILGENNQKAPLQEAYQQKKGDMKNVVHLKIKIPKDVLNLPNNDGGHVTKRLENEWNHFNTVEEDEEEEKEDTAQYSPMLPKKGQTSETLSHNQEPARKSGLNNNKTVPVRQDTKDNDPPARGNPIVGSSFVNNERNETPDSVGIPVKPPGKSVCDSEGCSCKGSSRNDKNIEKVRQSFDMTESELSLLEEAVHNSQPKELKIRTEYGSVNVISHEPDCKCEICETFGSHNDAKRKDSGRSDTATIISKKVVRVYYNGNYRNVVTHTEECGCDICSNIEEHSYKLMSRRASIVSTHRGDLVVKNKGVCGCKNCKTVEMGPHVYDVETMVSRTSSHALDKCYYSDATIPSIQSFPREVTSTDDQGASFSSPPSINSSDTSDDMYGRFTLASIVKTTDYHADNRRKPLTEFQVLQDVEPVRDANGKKCDRHESKSSLCVPRNTRKRIIEFVKPSTAKPFPAELETKRKEEYLQSPLNKYDKGTNKRDKRECIPKKSKFSTKTKELPPKPLERIPIIEEKHPTDNAVPTNNQKDEEKVSFNNAGPVTLEHLIRDLIQGRTGIQKDKVYTVTLGEVANKAYTKIHIVDCSSKSDEKRVQKNDANAPVSKPNGDASNSNVFFIKPLPNCMDEHPKITDFPKLGDCQNGAGKFQSMSSPACLQNAMKSRASSLAKKKEIGTARWPSDTSVRSDMPRAFKLTISFGKRVASLFRQRGKKRTISNNFLGEHQVPFDNKKHLKAYTIYETAKNNMELIQIEVKPQYYSTGSHAVGKEAKSPILCLVKKNSNTQVLASLAR